MSWYIGVKLNINVWSRTGTPQDKEGNGTHNDLSSTIWFRKDKLNHNGFPMCIH